MTFFLRTWREFLSSELFFFFGAERIGPLCPPHTVAGNVVVVSPSFLMSFFFEGFAARLAASQLASVHAAFLSDPLVASFVATVFFLPRLLPATSLSGRPGFFFFTCVESRRWDYAAAVISHFATFGPPRTSQVGPRTRPPGTWFFPRPSPCDPLVAQAFSHTGQAFEAPTTGCLFFLTQG